MLNTHAVYSIGGFLKASEGERNFKSDIPRNEFDLSGKVTGRQSPWALTNILFLTKVPIRLFSLHSII
jgi:hypothetical protein